MTMRKALHLKDGTETLCQEKKEEDSPALKIALKQQ